MATTTIQETDQVIKIKLENLTVKPSENERINTAKAKPTAALEYELGWAKAVRNNTVVGTIDLAAACAWVESAEIELNKRKGEAIIRLLADKSKLCWTNVSYFTKGSQLEDESKPTQEVNKTKLYKARFSSGARVCEAIAGKLYRIMLNKKLCLELVDRSTTVVGFKTNEINELLKQTAKHGSKAKAEQIDLQQNLEYNLEHKCKQYMQQPERRLGGTVWENEKKYNKRNKSS
ncbi:MAG: hypothetical protein P3M75_00150 [Candidatus Hodgkinia cicadicola]|nr:MAG: hypothetical protein P3M75_00150 [Candidatus Hodgkinia cicadicola]